MASYIPKERVYIKPEQVDSLIKKQGTKICYVSFTKRDGTTRRMYFHAKISRSLLKGGIRAYDPIAKRLTWVRDIKKPSQDCIRSIRWDAIIELMTEKRVYVVRH